MGCITVGVQNNSEASLDWSIIKVKFWVKVVVKVNMCVDASGFARWSMFVWLHLATPDVSVDSEDGASSGLIR